MTMAVHAQDNGSGEVEQYRPAAFDTYRSDAIARLADWAQSAEAAHAVATRLVQTSFVPEAFRGKSGEATAAILAGSEIGLSPMAALRSFDIIQGTAAPRANTLRAVVQSQGHKIRVVESTETRAIVEGRRRDESDWQRSVWTIDRAKKLGLTGKKNWQSQPQAMLVARATSEVCRLIASDAILGIAYSAEELFDDGPAEVGQSAPAPSAAPAEPPARRRAQRKPLERMPSAEPEPEGAAEPTAVDPEPDEDPATDVGMVSKKQQAHMFALWNELGFGGDENRDNRLTITAKILQSPAPIESSNDLTADEADIVIAALQAKKDARDGGTS